MKKRFLSLTLVFVLCLGLAVPAAAAESYRDSGSTTIPKLSKSEIAQLLEDNPLTLPDDLFDSVPSCSAPYAAGKVKTSALQTATNRLNALRQIAGVPAVQLDLELCEQAQYGAVILGAMGALSHSPSKPADMDDSFYEQAYEAVSSSNLYAGMTLTTAVDGFMNDSDAGNISRVGHRRWQLNPQMGKVGFGYAETNTGYRRYVTEKVFDRSGAGCEYDFIGWPASGNFPSNLFGKNIAWSVSVNPDIYQTPDQSALTVTLTRESDGKTWSFSGSQYTPSGSGTYFNVDTGGYGISNCIIFRPDGIENYEGIYTVRIDGLRTKNGTAVNDFEYQVDFFDPDNYKEEQPGSSFADISASHWAYASIEQAYQDGVIEGTYYNAQTGERHFSPDNTLTIAEFVAILTRAFYPDAVEASTADGSWYAKNYAVAEQYHLLDGLGSVNMESNATRYTMAQIMYNLVVSQSADAAALPQDSLKETQDKISDWSTVPEQYQTAVAVCYNLGLLAGTDDIGTFNGPATMQRSQCAVVYVKLRSFIDGLAA